MRCSACRREVSARHRFCPECGTAVNGGRAPEPALGGSGDETSDTEPTLDVPAVPLRAPTSSGPRSAGGEHYVPGTVIAGRYRVVSLLGRGGMGEVFRADDLKLGQPVALKFLPSKFENDPARLKLLLDEVRVARRVAHPCVCRVYDVGEAEGHHFISMEYVDGEDLATLLRRIGRLSGDKATQIARQVCAGLAAAHEQGVLHRDLKPANVMVDGQGRARITDFGLARETEAVAGEDARSGTPAYMAPEQLAGREATARSDLYALGLVLYELFTGRTPFEARTVAEAIDERLSGPPSSPSSHVENLDPAVERAIMSCLEPEPGERPGSALAVAGALPGGDFLAASLAAGETPSPEMVAAAATDGDEAWGFVIDQAIVNRMRQRHADVARMVDGGAPPLYPFFYRASPTALIPLTHLRVSPNDPPRGGPGSAMVTLDPEGRLLGLEIEPSSVAPVSGDEASVGSDARDSTPGEPLGDSALENAVLELAGLEPSALRPVEPGWLPPLYADERAAWSGRYRSGLDLRVEAAATEGRVSWLWVYSPELGSPLIQTEQLPPLFVVLLCVLFAVILATGAWFARSNLRSGRGDRRGAFRLGSLIAGTSFLAWLFEATHAWVLYEVVRLTEALASSLLLGVVTAMFYLGLEPALRRRWPHRIVSWKRALNGRLRDPLVGRDLLVGATATPLFLFLPLVWLELDALLEFQRPPRFVQMFESVDGGVPEVVATWPTALFTGILMVLGFMLMLFAITRVVRNEWVGAAIYCAILTFGVAVRDGVSEPFAIVAFLIPPVITAVVMLRFGLLAGATLFSLLHLGLVYPVIGFSGAWYAGGRMIVMATVVLVAAYGARCCARQRGLEPE